MTPTFQRPTVTTSSAWMWHDPPKLCTLTHHHMVS